jgi:uncharacterized protein (DUF4415 family)
MKLKKRVTKSRKIARLRASGSVEHERSVARSSGGGRSLTRRIWGKRALELKEWRRVAKKRVTVNLDADVVAWFRGMGRGYQWEINRTLRRVMEEEAKGREG